MCISEVFHVMTSGATEPSPNSTGSMGGVPRMITQRPVVILVMLEIFIWLFTLTIDPGSSGNVAGVSRMADHFRLGNFEGRRKSFLSNWENMKNV